MCFCFLSIIAKGYLSFHGSTVLEVNGMCSFFISSCLSFFSNIRFFIIPMQSRKIAEDEFCINWKQIQLIYLHFCREIKNFNSIYYLIYIAFLKPIINLKFYIIKNIWRKKKLHQLALELDICNWVLFYFPLNWL